MTDAQTAIFIAFGACYTYLMLHDPHRTVPGGPSHLATYYLSDWLIVLTVVIPRLVVWYWGMQALVNIGLYRRKVEGALYRDALKLLAYGLGGVFLVTILLRVLQTASDALNRLDLGGILLLLYILVFMLGIGYVLVAKGARQLQKIEEL
jgi:hypothetical protein